MDKAKRERDEMWALVNTDKYRTVSKSEQEKEKAIKEAGEAEDRVKAAEEWVRELQEKLR